jgi:ribosome-associated heat shock protein Hsp15
MTNSSPDIRIDKFLWSVRIFKTRSRAAQACELGKVFVGGQWVKASRMVRAGDEISIRFGAFTRIWKVITPVANRQPARLVGEYCTEITPADVLANMKAAAAARAAWRPPGSGRPTKKERRDLEDFLDWDDW